MRSLLLAVSFVVVGMGCSAPRCSVDAPCANGFICAPSGICLRACASDSQCGGGTCNTSGVCVSPTSGCAVSADCGAGMVCAPGGTCMAAMNPAVVDAGPASCGGQLFSSTPTEANVLIVLDRSGSMMESIGSGRSKWAVATEAVRRVTSQNAMNPRLRFGLQLFSNNVSVCNPGMIDVSVGAGNVTLISNALPTLANGRNTPIGAALNVAANSNELTDPTRANFVLLLTDGMENCSGAPVAEVEGLFNRGVRTYSVGFGDAVDGTRLTQMAIKGGTARATQPRYFQADDPAQLQSALDSIASGAASCDFTLSSTPPNANTLYVAVDGQWFPRDPARVAGWDYQAAGNRVTLYGPACDVVAQRPGAKVSIVFGCPDDSIVEIGPGGRLPIGGSTDGGGGFGWLEDGGVPEIN
jgi:hypothetical protein